MALPKPDKTLADYLGIAVCPLLIMLMIGSVMFFMLEISYEGEFAGRLRWTVFWFVLASVLISRISIEQGSSYAGVYGVALAVVTGLMLSRFVNFVLGVWCFLAAIWWCASKLTWDCTMIDEGEDASGEGLLQVARLDGSAKETEKAEGAEDRPSTSIPLWRQLFQNRSERAGQPHAPGLWVIYFSLVALPSFGVGQLVIPHDEAGRRRYGFILLWAYTAAALGLLLTTSFLGLRRYLRQRRLQMSFGIARTWIGFGLTLAGAILLFCALLPRPEAEYSLTALVGRISSPAGAGSGYLFFREHDDDDGGPLSGRNKQAGKKKGEGNVETGNAPGQSDGASGNDPGNGPDGRPKSRMPIIGFWLANVLRWILYALFAALIVYGLVRNWRPLVEALKQVVQDFLNFLRRLCGWRPRDSSPNTSALGHETSPAAQRTFASFADPFATGKPLRMPLADLICYTFEALQSCARECGVPRRPEQTPLEFGSLLARTVPELCSNAPQATQLYARLAYAGRVPGTECLEGLERLWRQMATVAAAGGK